MIAWSILLAFATWRVSSLLYIESPFDWLRKWLHVEDDMATGARTVPDNVIGALFDCFWCMSLVVAFVFAVVTYILTDLNIYEALAYTVPGIIAHESALRGGEQLKIPQFDPKG